MLERGMSNLADDIVAVGGDLEPETLVYAYRRGVFPWPAEGLPLLWYCPRERAILELDRVHVGRTLARERRRSPLRLSTDEDFAGVMAACAATPRPGQAGTWITPAMLDAYKELHRLGVTHSVEAWDSDDLVGGIYGVDVDGAFAAESMFYRRPYASKLALLHLIDHLRSRGLGWIDIQVMTPHMERLGATTIGRASFLRRLNETRRLGLTLF